MRQKLADSTRWVIKIGSALLTNDGQGLDNQAIADWTEQIAELRKMGKEILRDNSKLRERRGIKSVPGLGI